MKKYLFILFFLTGCFEDNRSPEAALKSFIDERMGTIVSRDEVLEKVTGKMRQSLENISEEDFQKFADLKSVSRESFKILSKSCQNEKCFLTYSMTYKSTTPDQAKFSTEVKKIAELHNVKGKWLISDVSNIKTYHEALNPIDALGDQAQ
jgi:hypothetical protein